MTEESHPNAPKVLKKIGEQRLLALIEEITRARTNEKSSHEERLEHSRPAFRSSFGDLNLIF